jgi:hypothetical protein
MNQFLYDSNSTHEENFCEWFYMNTEERLQYNQKRYSNIMARLVFEKQYGFISSQKST